MDDENDWELRLNGATGGTEGDECVKPVVLRHTSDGMNKALQKLSITNLLRQHGIQTISHETTRRTLQGLSTTVLKEEESALKFERELLDNDLSRVDGLKTDKHTCSCLPSLSM